MIATSTGARIAGITQSPKGFVDSFTRPNGDLGNGWIDGHSVLPNHYEPLGINDGAVVVSNPTSRVGVEYAADQTESHPPLDGKQYVGIGCAWRDMGTTEVYVEAEWSGLSLSPFHVEAGACVHFAPGTTEQCLGIWPSELVPGLPNGLFFICALGAPPENLTIYAHSSFPIDHGVPRTVGVRTNGTTATFWSNGVQVSLSPTAVSIPGYGYGLNPFPIPAPLLGSTLHGMALDTHLVNPWSLIPTTPVINKIKILPI